MSVARRRDEDSLDIAGFVALLTLSDGVPNSLIGGSEDR